MHYGARNRLGLFLGPVLFCALLLLPGEALEGDARRVTAVTALMATWWICESIPLAATALIPLAALPLMRIMPMADVARLYAAPEIFLFLGGFFIAVAMQRWNLHRRIALAIVCRFGCRGERLVLGFMIATAFISLWVSNTATAMMMLPIGMAVMTTLGEHCGREGGAFDDFRMALMLAIAYGASIGGIGTLIGTPPNIVFAAQARALFPQAEPVSFIKWMAVGLPFAALFIPIAWLVLTRISLRGAAVDFGDAHAAIETARRELGPIGRGERLTLAVFALTVAAWITRADVTIGGRTFPGWESLLSLGAHVHDGTVAILAALALFVIPVDWKRGVFVLDWRAASDIPWGILILFGGGIALGKAFIDGGLAAKIALAMGRLEGAPPVMIVAATALIVTFLTEITSNTAIASIMLPIVGATAVGLRIHPYLLMIPAAISASCAFMLPVATPPNAIVFSTGAVSMTGMVKIGFLMNLIGVVLVTLVMYLLAVHVFGIAPGVLPAWAAP